MNWCNIPRTVPGTEKALCTSAIIIITTATTTTTISAITTSTCHALCGS